MSDMNTNPYLVGITLEEALSDTRAPAVSNAAGEAEYSSDVDEPPMTAAEMAIALAAYAPRNQSSSAPPDVTRPAFGAPSDRFSFALAFRPAPGNRQVLAAEHALGGWSSSDDMTPPSSGMLVGPAVAEASGAGTGNNKADGLDRDTNHSGGLAMSPGANTFASSTIGYTTPLGYFGDDEQNNDPALHVRLANPNRSQPVGLPVDNATYGGYFDSNGVHIANAVPARFFTDFASPYVGDSDTRTCPPCLDTSGCHMESFVPGLSTLTSIPSLYARHSSEKSSGDLFSNIDVNGTHIDPVNSAYPDPYKVEPSYGGRWFTSQGPFGDTAPYSLGDYNGYQHVAPTQQHIALDQFVNPNQDMARTQQHLASDQYMDPNQNLDHLQQIAPNQYMGPNQHMADHQGMAPHRNIAPHPVIAKDKSKGFQQRVYKGKKTFGTLYDENGRLPFPTRHYNEYMNGTREMNGKLAESQLAPIPCRDCARNGLTCSVLSREGDHGKVFTRMRKPWRNQVVSNYIVCGNCWKRAGSPQTCSFWRRPEGKETPPIPIR